IPIPPRFGKRLIAAAAVVVLGLVAGTWWFTRTPPPPKQHEPMTVIIADFDNTTGDPTFDHTLEPKVKLALEGAGVIHAYDRSRIRSTFAVQPPEKLDSTAARQIAVKQGVGVVLWGSIGPRSGGGYDIGVNAIQTVTGNTIATLKDRASSKDQVL